LKNDGKMKAKLILEDGSVWEGEGFGSPTNRAGEVVFSTAMTGYPESLTDPSYKGQILVFTYPLVGNYGVPEKCFFQSESIQVSGVIVTHHCLSPHHYQSKKTLHFWLKENQVPGIAGIDTRALTQKIRRRGTMLGKIVITPQPISFYNPDKDNLLPQVSPPQEKFFLKNKSYPTVCLIDCGCKRAIKEMLLAEKINLWQVPWDFNPFKKKRKIDALVVSNGPGNPIQAQKTIQTVKIALKKRIPFLGICLGNQILALAAGAKTYKLKFGHRSVNQPVQDLRTGRCYITSQNHGFAVDPASLPPRWKVWFVNLNDKTVEGIISSNGLFRGVQFHPEGHPGPQDTASVFKDFINQLYGKS